MTTLSKLWLFKSHSHSSDLQAVCRVLERETWWSGGDEVRAFESAIADYTGRQYGVATNSGTSALISILLALDIAGGEVIVSSFTYPATVNAIVIAGGLPVFADIERKSFGLDVQEVEKKITEHTKAILPTHFAGNVCSDIFDLKELAKDKGIFLVEDTCHALGSTYLYQKAGSFGEAAAFSFAFNKLISTGEGGMVVTDSSQVASDVRKIKSAGKNILGKYTSYGYNFLMSSISAALGLSQFSRISQLIGMRERAVEYLNDELEGIGDLTLPHSLQNQSRVYLYYNLLLPDHETRTLLRAHLSTHEIPTRITYQPVHLTPYYSGFGWKEGDLPITEEISNRILTLPLYPQIETGHLDHIAQSVRDFFER